MGVLIPSRYNVYRSTSAGGPYSLINGSLLANSEYFDTDVSNGESYYYVVTALDSTGNESGNSEEASAQPASAGDTGLAWINEFHYDNDGADSGEFVEVAGEAGLDLSGW